jgi:hypothetical protein
MGVITLRAVDGLVLFFDERAEWFSKRLGVKVSYESRRVIMQIKWLFLRYRATNLLKHFLKSYS